jgi:hypothetical protein
MELGKWHRPTGFLRETCESLIRITGEATTHEIQFGKLQEWLEGGARSPNVWCICVIEVHFAPERGSGWRYSFPPSF